MTPNTKQKLLGMGAGVITVLTAHFGISVYKVYHDPNTMRTKELSLEALNTVEIPPENNKKIPDYTKMTWQQAIEEVKTPREAREYIKQIISSNDKNSTTVNSFAVNHYNRKGDKKGACHMRCLTAATLLSDDGYTPNMLLLISENLDIAHTEFIYKTKDGIGVINKVRADPEFKTIEELITEVGEATGTKYRYYKLCDLNYTYPSQEWISGKNPLARATAGLDVLTTFNRIK